ncbi:hypothetical protein [Tabrizicola sp. BL-A-41-H6]|uniref:hypothetical protein n=1 Tax=Tabrizicola sp. BL-A-41-H6 TaxID=3421107 RepID=UPI003D66BCC9
MKTKTITLRIPVISLPKVTLPITVSVNPDFALPKLPRVRMPFAFKRKSKAESVEK